MQSSMFQNAKLVGDFQHAPSLASPGEVCRLWQLAEVGSRCVADWKRQMDTSKRLEIVPAVGQAGNKCASGY